MLLNKILFSSIVLFSTVFFLTACEKEEKKQANPQPTSVKTAPKAVAAKVTKNDKAEAEVFFLKLKDGDVVKSPLHIQFGVKGMQVSPAGKKLGDTHAGHHHIIVDGNFIENSKVVPKDEQHIHFGGGQTEADLVLKSGKHSLTLQFANGVHQSYGKVMSKTIQITVE